MFTFFQVLNDVYNINTWENKNGIDTAKLY